MSFNLPIASLLTTTNFVGTAISGTTNSTDTTLKTFVLTESGGPVFATYTKP